MIRSGAREPVDGICKKQTTVRPTPSLARP